jgi:hypothetical protein
MAGAWSVVGQVFPPCCAVLPSQRVRLPFCVCGAGRSRGIGAVAGLVLTTGNPSPVNSPPSMRRRNASSARRVVERRLFSEYIEKLLRGCFLAVALAARLFLLYAKGDFLSISVENNNKNKNHSKKSEK